MAAPFRSCAAFLGIAVALVVCCAVPGGADGVPKTMNYQGYLTDLNNSPRQGTFKMEFGLFADSTGGTPMWTETYAGVSVSGGIFNVLLGTVNSLPPVLFTGARLWLETAISDTTLAPRRSLVTVPYAFRAQNADTAAVALGAATGEIVGQVQITCGSNAGVVVYIPGRSFVAFTGAPGTFDLGSVPPGTYSLHIEASNPTRTADVNDVVVTAGGTTNVGVIAVGVNLATDPNNCGSCGNVCPPVAFGVPGCAAGTCGIGSCISGFADCNNNPADGCEVYVVADVNHCGACQTPCPPVSNGTPVCASSTCGIGSCNLGFGNCDGNTANGCETPTSNDVNNCGGCGAVCSIANATSNCLGGKCFIGSCNSGFSDCNHFDPDGCEVNLATNVNNCGSCGNVCPGAQVCIGGVCQ